MRALLLVLIFCTTAHAEDFKTSFDPGNRVVLQFGIDEAAAELDARSIIKTNDPAVTWRLEHRFLRAGQDGALLYAGRYTRHSRDGRLTLPTSPPRAIRLPFDVGAEATVGAFTTKDLEIVGIGAFADLARSPDFRRRLAIVALARWDADLQDGTSVTAHRVAPFSIGALDGRLESKNGLTVLAGRVEGGTEWSTVRGWHPTIGGELSLERILLAVNDRPISLYGGVRRRSDETQVLFGVRFAVLP